MYGAGVDLSLHLGSYFGGEFKPGVNADADGWLWWPTLGVGYDWDRGNEFGSDAHSFFNGISTVTSIDQWVEFTSDQVLDLQLTLPLATWLSVGGTYSRCLESDFSQSDGPWTNTTYGQREAQAYWASAYIDLVPGAGADTARPFVPHYGRLGQLVVNLQFERMVFMAYSTAFDNLLSLTVGAPVASNLAVALGYSQATDGGNTVQQRSISAQLSLAFGDPAHRE